ncbi:unnamed protein product [Rotaria sp. Silwood2]|nr:unnamed protein product [Rotaria sp. Silwood2]CAF2958660.1 unnamed protein product [Rotaria sp. Silwood2]CAF3333570.1 unnamed protein product [Rotaria sp. Silwood2]CAF3965708.1 unnamed protein product [Rotaria sp. Silwood2]CAF4096529.1 unnamed protein product [Rotaria sp. Silwood2]
MKSTNELGLVTERVQVSTQVDLSELVCSTICENILWKPVSCQQCETHFCSTCIRQWLIKRPNQCPIRCDTFIERPCSKFIARQLAKLQIACIHQPNGCKEIIPYEALEKHEMMCGYQLVKCTACEMEILQRNLSEHQSQCSLIPQTTADCKILYQRDDTFERRSDINSIREELRQECRYEIQQLKQEVRQAQSKKPKHSNEINLYCKN